MPQAFEVDPASVIDASARMLATYNAELEGFHGVVAEDITLSAMGLPIARVNTASGARVEPARVDERIGEVIAWFAAIGVPFSWRVGPRDRPRDLGDRLIARGFKPDPEDIPAMARSLDDLPPQVLPPGGSVAVVADESAFLDWVSVVREGFGMPPPIADAIVRYGELGFGDDLAERLVLARYENRPVATALAAVAGHGVTIINVTTLEDMRGRGFGGAVTLAAMELGRAMGARIAVLESTEMGFSVYRRLGFDTFAKYRRYIWDPANR